MLHHDYSSSRHPPPCHNLTESAPQHIAEETKEDRDIIQHSCSIATPSPPESLFSGSNEQIAGAINVGSNGGNVSHAGEGYYGAEVTPYGSIDYNGRSGPPSPIAVGVNKKIVGTTLMNGSTADGIVTPNNVGPLQHPPTYQIELQSQHQQYKDNCAYHHHPQLPQAVSHPPAAQQHLHLGQQQERGTSIPPPDLNKITTERLGTSNINTAMGSCTVEPSRDLQQNVNSADDKNYADRDNDNKRDRIDFTLLLDGSRRRKQKFPTIRPTRECVIKRLSDALMRRSLTKIDLSQRGLIPSDARLLKLALMQNESLSILKLGYNNLGDEGLATLASGIKKHSSLSSFDIGFNNVGDEGCVALAEALSVGQRGVMETLCLSGNVVGKVGARALAAALDSGGAQDLKKLYLTGNGVGDEGIQCMMAAFTRQELKYNPVCGRKERGLQPVVSHGGQALQQYCIMNSSSVEELGLLPTSGTNHSSVSPSTTHLVDDQIRRQNSKMKGMTELFLCKTNMAQVGFSSVAFHLHQTTTLRVLSLAQCNLTDQNAVSLANSLYNNRHNIPLESLLLSFNNLNPKGFEALVGSVACLGNLKEFMVDNNAMGGRGAHVLSTALLAASSPSNTSTIASAASTFINTCSTHDSTIIPNPLSNVTTPQILLFPTLTKLDVGFNKISGSGMRALMKSIANNTTLVSLSLSGNVIDTATAKAVAYVMAHNISLKSVYLDHCGISAEGESHVTAGIVSNCRTRLQTLTGFQLGVNSVCLGLPSALEHWTNEKVLRFILLMWEHNKLEQEELSTDKELDPLHHLPAVEQPAPHSSTQFPTVSHGMGSSTSNVSSVNSIGPLDPRTVVAVAKRTYESIHSQPITNGVNYGRGEGKMDDEEGSGLEQAVRDRLLKLQINSAVVREEREANFDSPVTEDAIILETNGVVIEGNNQYHNCAIHDENNNASTCAHSTASNPKSTAATHIQTPPIPDDLIVRRTTPLTFLDLPARKKKIVEWLCKNLQHLNELSLIPFDSSELIRLYQHFFSPGIHDTWQPPDHLHHDNYTSDVRTYCPQDKVDHGLHYQTGVATIRKNPTNTPSVPGSMAIPSELTCHSSTSDRGISCSDHHVMGTIPILKRKVSYRHLHEANNQSSTALSQLNSMSNQQCSRTNNNKRVPKAQNERSSTISKLIEDQHRIGVSSMQPKSKRARRNRSRISFVPRFKAKLDSFLDSCHHKALILMRQLVYVERMLLNSEIYPIECVGSTPYLVGVLAADAEMILLDMV